jgi:CubicO group peptidase (beta-lactamase class C family)
VSLLIWQSGCRVATIATVVVVTGCVGAGAPDPIADPEASPPIESPTAPASTTTSIGNGSDAAAAAFTRAMFADVPDDEPGCTVAVGRGGAVVFAEAYGAARLDPLEPMTVDTVVDIASVSKQFTATAILLLAERGEIDLDAPLSAYLPDLAAWASQPTLRQLIHHQSGIPDYIDLLPRRGFAETGSSPTAGDALAALGDVADLESAPGESWSYSNSNYFLLSQVVLAVTGKDLGAFLDAEVFGPLGLEMVMDPLTSIENKAVSYERVDGAWQPWENRWEPNIGAGAVQTTPSQLVVWAAQYWEPTIGAATIAAERLDGAADVGGGETYGAGIIERDVGGAIGQVLGHGGQWDGFNTVFSVAPEHRVAVAVSCTTASAMQRLGRTFDVDLLGAWIGGE